MATYVHSSSCSGCPFCHTKMAALVRFGQDGRNDVLAEIYKHDFSQMQLRHRQPLPSYDAFTAAGSEPPTVSLFDALRQKGTKR